MLLAIGLIITLVGFVYSFIKPYKGLLFIIASKSVLDAAWNEKIAGINPLMVIGVFVPVFFYIHIKKNPLKYRIERKWRNLVFIYFMAVSFAFVFAPIYNNGFMGPFGTFMKTINGVVAILLFPVFFNTKKSFEDLLKAMIIAGIFPILIGMYESVTGNNINYHSTIGRELIRNIGFYHDMVTVRFYAAQTIIASFLLLSYYKTKFFYKYLSISLSIMAVVVVYHAYSKAGYAIFIIWFALFALVKRNKYMIAVAILLSLSAGAFFQSEVFKSVEITYEKELKFEENELADDRYVFAGRGFIWEDYLNMWSRFDFFGKVMGTGKPNNAHNEQLRILITNGILGLVFYAVFLFSILYYIAIKFFKRNTPLVFSAILIIVMYLIDCMGVMPGIYPSYQWFTWGMIGLAFTRLNYELIPIEKQKRLKHLNNI